MASKVKLYRCSNCLVVYAIDPDYDNMIYRGGAPLVCNALRFETGSGGIAAVECKGHLHPVAVE